MSTQTIEKVGTDFDELCRVLAEPTSDFCPLTSVFC